MADEQLTEAITSDEPHALAEFAPNQVERARFEIESEQNLVMGAVAGVVAGGLGALIWAAVTVATSYQIGWLAIGIGFLVGAAVRWGGRGTTRTFGVIGGALAMVSVVVGNFLSLLGLLAGDLGMSYVEVATEFDYSQTLDWLVATFSPIDLLFYGIAIWQGYQVSIREITAEEIHQRLTAEGIVPMQQRPMV